MPKILIVDDDTTMVSLLETLLMLDGFDVVVAKRGGDVISKAEAERPDVMMIDYHLTDMEGVEAIEAVRAHATLSGTPIVMASGLNVEHEALKAGANRFLIKPFEPSELPKVFNELINE